MAEPAALIVEKIIGLAFAIKKAVETVRENEEECRGIEHRVVRVSELLSLLNRESDIMKHQAMSTALEDLEDAVSRAHEIIVACQGKNIMCLFCVAGKLAKKLRQVQDDISHKMMHAIFASNVVIFVATKIQHSALLPFFVPTNLAPPPFCEHLPSPPVLVVADLPPSLPTRIPPPSHALVAGEDQHSHPPKNIPNSSVADAIGVHNMPFHSPTSPPLATHIPPSTPRPLAKLPRSPHPPPRLDAYIPPIPPANLAPTSKHLPPYPTTQPQPQPQPRQATSIPSPAPSTTEIGPPQPKHQHKNPPTKQPPQHSLPPVTKIAHPQPKHSHPYPSTSVPLRSPVQSTKEAPAPASGSVSSTLSAEDVSSRSEVKDERKKVPVRSEESSPLLPGLTKFSLSELKAARQNFSEENKVGSIDSGVVYKGVLPGGIMVTIKEFRGPSQHIVAQICTELHLASELQNGKVEVLGSTDRKMNLTTGVAVGKGIQNTLSGKNKNIITILGYGLEFILKPKHVQPHIFLVQEYMPNGSMADIIYGPPIKWSSRFQIIQGLARGLQYLHEKNIVHMNVKPTNILLDSGMNPKIAGFGIARILEEPVIQDSSIVGTVGYMPPEYILEGILSRKYDVHSFGIILLETISGMCRDEPARHQASIQWAWKVYEYQTMDELFHPSLCDASQLMEIKRCLKIGLLCTQYELAKRPTMADVLHMLSGKKELPTPNQPEYTKEKAKPDKVASRKPKNRR
ncbi:hypothetical protein ACP4OV_002278 [Aristida adscensionis]